MTGTAIVSAIVEILVSGLTSIGTAIGGAFSSMAEAIFIYTPTSGTATLSTFGTLIVVFAGVSLGLSLVRWVMNFISSFGNRNR